MLIDIPDKVNKRIAEFSGRAWILPQLVDWFENRYERHFLITGEPGTGKSMLVAWLAGHGPVPQDPAQRQDMERLRQQVGGAHFCEFNTGSTSAAALAANLAQQLANCIPAFQKALLETLSERVVFAPHQEIGEVTDHSQAIGMQIDRLDLSGLDEQFSFDRALRFPLIKLYQQGYQKRLMLMVDALDEAYASTRGLGLVQILSGLTDLPPQVRWLLTTRPDPRILKTYRRTPKLDLVKDCPAGEAEIQTYVKGRLAGSRLTAAQQNTLAEAIEQNAEDYFLYASLVLDDLLQRLEKGSLPASFSFPRGLEEIYADFLNRELGQDEDRWYQEFLPVLGLLAVAQGDGLSSEKLVQWTGLEVNPILRICSQYLEGDFPQGPFRLFHKSLSDYLLDEQSNVDYHIDGYRMHQRIVDKYYAGGNGSPPFSSWDDYGWRFFGTHLAGAALAPEPLQKHQSCERLANLILNDDFLKLYKQRVPDLSLWGAELARALQLLSRDAQLEALPLLVRVCRTIFNFRTDQLRPELVIEPAEQGRVDEALRNLALFSVETRWQQAAALWIAWAGLDKNREAAEKLYARLEPNLLPLSILRFLASRVKEALDGAQPWQAGYGGAIPTEGVIRDIVQRMGGQAGEGIQIDEYASGISFNPETLIEALAPHTPGGSTFQPYLGEWLPPNLNPNVIEGVTSVGAGGPLFKAQLDGPLLVVYCKAEPQKGEPYWRTYLDLHAANLYLYYRNISLWLLMDSVLRYSGPEWMRRQIGAILKIALDSRGLRFDEGFSFARLAQGALAGRVQDGERLEQLRQQAVEEAEKLHPSRGLDDSWGEHKRRLAALAEAFALLPGEDAQVEHLLDKAYGIPRGFAGFMVPAWLNLAEAVLVSGKLAQFPTSYALQQARVSAHKVQESVFCARNTARVNAMQQRWWPFPPNEDLLGLVERFVQEPEDGLFSALYMVGEAYDHRQDVDDQGSPANQPPMPMMELDPALTEPVSLRRLSQAFDLPVDDFLDLNPGWDVDDTLPFGLEVNVPDPVFKPWLAARLSAELCARQDISLATRRRWIQALIPLAIADETSLYTVMGRLLHVAGPLDPDVLDQLAM
jgi:hypothetical protein